MGDYFAKTVVISVGSTYRKLGIPLEEELIGSGVHFCATCDGAFYRDKVSIINNRETFTASETYIEKLEEIDNIDVYTNKNATSFLKNEDDTFKGIQLKDNKTGEVTEVHADGAFIFIGLIPNTQAFKDII